MLQWSWVAMVTPGATEPRNLHSRGICSSVFCWGSLLPKGKKMALLPASLPQTHLDEPNPLFLFMEYMLLNPCCVPGTVLGNVGLLFPCPGRPVPQITTWLAAFRLFSFKSFTQISLSQGAFPGLDLFNRTSSLPSPRPPSLLHIPQHTPPSNTLWDWLFCVVYLLYSLNRR